MEKRFSVLLCTAVLIGAMNTLPALSEDKDITGNYNTSGEERISEGETWNIDGCLNNGSGNSIINNGSIISNTIINNSTIEGEGTLTLKSGTAASDGSIIQGAINLDALTFNNRARLEATTKLTNKGFLNNSSSIIAAEIDNQASIKGEGTLTASGSNSGTIQQSSVVLNGNLINTKTIEAATLTTDSNKLINNSGAIVKITSSASGTIEGSGTTEIKGSNSADINQNSVTVTGDLINTGSIIAKTITNNSNLENNNVLGDSNSDITNAGIITNNGTITANLITNDNKINNEGSITTGSLINNSWIRNNSDMTVSNGLTNASGSKIDGTGDLSVAGTSSNDGTITQNNISVSGDFANNGDMTANVKLTNNGIITNSKNIIAKLLDNKATIKGNGSLTADGGENSGTIQQSNVTLNGDLTNTNTGNIETTVLDTKTNTLTNNGALKVTSSTSGSIDGNGSMEIAGINNAEINQSSVSVIGNLENNSTIVAADIENKAGVTLNNSGTLGDNTSAITNNGTLNNTGSVVANTIINTGTKFVNDGSIIAITIDNRSTMTNNKTIVTDTIQNASGADINGSNGSLTINNGGSNAGTIVQKDINLAGGTLENSGSMTANGKLTNTGTINTAENSNIIIATIDNTANIQGDGNITISSGTNSGTIEQKDVTLNTSLNNTGTLTSSGSFINYAEITGEGTLNIKNGGSVKSITQDNVNISGTFTNGAALNVNELLKNDGKITNRNVITAVINNTTSGVIEGDAKGAGSINISGASTNEGRITQGSLHVTDGTLENTGSIVANTFTNDATVNDTKNSGSLIINKTGTNNGSITQNIITNNGILTNNKTETISAAITAVTLNNNATLNNKGTVTTVDFNNIANAELTNDGTFTVNGSMNNKGTITNKGVFNSGAGSTLTNGGTFINSGENAEMSATDIINNNVFGAVEGAEMTLDNIQNNGTIKLENSSSITITSQREVLGGTINVNGDTNTLNVTGEAIASTINIGKNTPITTLKVDKGIIAEAAKVTIANTSTLNVAGADVTLDSNDSWIGSVTLDSGSLTVDNLKNNGQLLATGGNLTLAENGGTLNIGSGSSIAEDVVANIGENSTLNIQNGGKVALNTGDTWNGKIILGTIGAAEVEDLDNIPANATTLDVKGLDKTGTLLANNGVLLLGDKDLDIQGESYIEKAVAMELGGNIKVSNGGRVAIDDNDKMTGSAPTVTLNEGGTLNYGKTVDSGLIIKADAGNLNLLAGSNLTFKEGSIADAVAIDIQKDANLTLEGSTLNLDSADQWNGNIINKGGVINANHLTKSSNTATLTQSTGDLNLYNDTNLVLGTESSISGGNINITKGDDGTNGSVLTVYGNGDKDVISGGDMTIDEYSKFVLGSGKFTIDTLTASAVQNPDGTIQAALVDVMNGEISESKIGSVIIASGADKINQANFNIDILARSNERKDNDTFRINSIADDATVYINQWGLGGDIYGWDAPIDRHIKMKDIFLDEDGNALLNNIEVTKDTTFTPIGWYQLNKNEEYEPIIDPDTGLPMIDPATGMIMKNHVGSNYTLDLAKFNPQVFRGQIATVAQWMNQLNINDMLFTHSMVLPSFKEADGGMMANRYAAESPLFAPYQYSRKDGGLWYKMYGTFENLQMNNNLGRVGNNAYGALIGADFGLKDLKNGWKFMPTAYVGYNGAHQTFAHMGQYQNGGQAGFMGTWYKNNVILGALVYGGIYDNAMDVHGTTDNTFNYFAGSAFKAAYNIRLHRDWVLQPNLFASYNYFGQQNWHSKFGQMGMMAGDLNGVNVAPGVNLIWERETFSAYGTLQYMYNVNGACGGRAGNVGLPQVEMERGYIQYGLGINKRFTDRASGYLQAVLRNVGRTGVGFQAGFNYMIGK